MAYRTYKRHLTAADRRAKVIIEACVEAGAEIEYLADASRFRYTPLHMLDGKRGTSFEPAHDERGWRGPSKRGSIACGRGNVLKLKTWSPSKLDANPMYHVPMAGDDEDLRHARYQWAQGNPLPLRAYLTQQAAERRASAPAPEPMQLELAEAA